MYKKLYLIPFIALILTAYPAYAASPSPSPSPSDNSSTVNENLKKRLQESLASSDDTTTATQDTKGYIGKIKDIIKDTVIMEDKDGKKDLKLTSTTNIVRSPGSSAIKSDDMRIGDYIIAIGIPKETDVLEAKRLIVSIDPIQTSTKTSGFGTISKLSKTSLTLLVEGSDKVIEVNTKSLYKSAVATIDFADLSLGDTVIYTATKDDDDILTASVIMRVKTAALSE
jgi:hypothetical protein